MNADEVQADQTGECLKEAAPEQTFGPSEAEEIRLGTWHARQTPAGGPTVENPWMKAERLEKEMAAEKRVSESLTKRYYSSEFACRALEKQLEERAVELDHANVQYRKLRDQMPKGTILYKECRKGHGWLTASNWAHRELCPTCARQSVEKDRDLWQISAKRWIEHASKLQNELQIAKFEAADLKLLLAEAKSIEKSKEFSRNWHFVSICAVLWVAIGVAVAVSLKFLQ